MTLPQEKSIDPSTGEVHWPFHRRSPLTLPQEKSIDPSTGEVHWPFHRRSPLTLPQEKSIDPSTRQTCKPFYTITEVITSILYCCPQRRQVHYLYSLLLSPAQAGSLPLFSTVVPSAGRFITSILYCCPQRRQVCDYGVVGLEDTQTTVWMASSPCCWFPTFIGNTDSQCCLEFTRCLLPWKWSITLSWHVYWRLGGWSPIHVYCRTSAVQILLAYSSSTGEAWISRSTVYWAGSGAFLQVFRRKVQWTSPALWMAVVSQSKVKSRWQEMHKLPLREHQHTLSLQSPKSLPLFRDIECGRIERSRACRAIV